MLKILKSKSGEASIDLVIMVLCAMLVLALCCKVLPVFVLKQQLDNFATELCREAEIAGQVGAESARREQALQESLGITPAVTWSRRGRLQLNEEFTVTVTLQYNLGCSVALDRSLLPCAPPQAASRRCTTNDKIATSH